MTCVAVVLLNADCMRLANNVAGFWQNLSESLPIISKKDTIFTVFYFVIESSEGCSITIAEYPCHSFPCATINGFDEPKFVFFDPIKCHISSNSISSIVPHTSGSSILSPYVFIHLYTSVWSIFKSLPIILKEPFAIAYSKIHNAFFAAIFLFVRLSPFLKLYPHSLHLYLCFSPTFPFFTTFFDSHLLHVIIFHTPFIPWCIHYIIYLYFSQHSQKFIYGLVREGARAHDYEEAMLWLLDSGLLRKVSRITKPSVPLKAYEDLKAFKLYHLDIGLLRYMSELSPSAILSGIKLFEEFKGALTEQFVLSELAGKSFIRNIYYWTSDATAEVDFVFADDKRIYPVEVKSGESLRAKSLKVYRERYSPELSIRTSLSNLRLDDGLLNIPLYALFNLENYL